MSRIFTGIIAVIGSVMLTAPLALANEGTGKPPDYSGISYLYYTLIAAIVGYGVYDTFFKKS